MRREMRLGFFLFTVYSVSSSQVGAYDFSTNENREVLGLSGTTDTTDDRKDDYIQAQDKGGTGSNVADLTGAMLVARAAPLLASPWPADRAAGATLMAMAGMEFAQGANDRGANQDNSKGQAVTQVDENAPQNQKYNNTKNGAGTDSTQVTGPGGSAVSPDAVAAQNAEKINTPEFRAAMESLGIDPAEAAQKIALGQISDEAAAAKLFGIDTNGADSALTNKIKDAVLSDVFKKRDSDEQFKKVVTDDKAGRGLASEEKAGAKGNSDPTHKGDGIDDLAGKSLLAQLLGQGKEGDSVAAKWDSSLLKIGIQRGSKYLNIFQKATISYKKCGQRRMVEFRRPRLKTRS